MARPIGERLNQRDPSGLRATEDRRAREIGRELDALLKRVLAQVNAESTPADIKHVVDVELAGYRYEVKDKILGWVEDTQRRSVLRSRQLLKASGVQVGAILGPAGLPQDVRDRITANVESEIDSMSADLKKQLTSSLLEGLEAGEGARDLSKRVAGDLAMDRNRAELIARTETMRAFNDTAVAQYRTADVEKVQWWAAIDDRTCDVCGDFGGYHGKIFDIDKAPECPAHPRCRCVLLPVIDEV